MKELTDADRGRIALKILIAERARRSELPEKNALRRELPNMAKEVDESVEDLEAFIRDILPQVIGKRFGCKEVSLVW